MIWPEFILLAYHLARQGSEAAKRSAVSRAYYGAYNPARRWSEANLRTIDRWATHRQMWGSFAASGVASDATRLKWEAVGEIGDSLRALRNRADYDDAMPDLDRHAAEAVVSAKKILALLPELELAA